VDSAGNIYVLDGVGFRAEKFNSAGVYLTQFATLAGAGALGIDSSGDIVVLDQRKGQKYSVGLIPDPSDNALIASSTAITLSADAAITNLTIMANGSLDLNGHTLYVGGNWSNSGTFVANGGTVAFQGTNNTIMGENSFYNLTKIATSTGFLYLPYNATTTITNDLVLSGTTVATLGLNSSFFSGTFDSKFGTNGTGDGQLKNPHDLAFDAQGNIYVSDTQNHRIQVFDSSGAYVSKFGSSGTAEGQFANPLGIAFDSTGNIYVADNQNYRVQKFDSDHNFVKMWGWGVATGADQFEICTSSCHIGLSTSDRDVDGMMWNPHGIKVGPDNHVYVTQYYGNNRPFSSIEEFDLDGNFVSRWSTWFGPDQIGLVGGYGIDFDSHGNMFVADAGGGRVEEFDSNHNFVKMWGWGVATGAYELEVCTANCLYGITGHGVGQISYIATGLVIDEDDNVYVAENTGDRVQKFSPDGVYLGVLGSTGSGNGQFNNPYGLAMDSNGDLYVADSNNHRIQKFSMSQTPAVILPQGTTDASYLSVSGVVNADTDPIDCSVGCLDDGGNTNWTIPAPVVTSGGGGPSYTVTSVGPSNVGYVGGIPTLTINSSANSSAVSVATISSTTTASTTSASSNASSTVETVACPHGFICVLTSAHPNISAGGTVYEFTDDLKFGNKGADVLKLQKFLKTNGYMTATPNGVFGPATRAAVIKFQKAHDIRPAVGYFGPVTRGVVNNL
jgi:hypothetical protein